MDVPGRRPRRPSGRRHGFPLAFAAAVCALWEGVGVAAAQPTDPRPRRPLVVVVESLAGRTDPDLLRARLALALDRPVLSAADSRAPGVDEVLALTVGADGSWAMATHLSAEGVLSLATLEGPPSVHAVPAWLPDQVAALVLAAARPPDDQRGAAAGGAGGTVPSLDTELTAWRIPQEVIDPFPDVRRPRRPLPAMSYELLDPWAHNRPHDPWRSRSSRGQATDLAPPPEGRR